MELILVVGAPHARDQPGEPVQDEAVDLVEPAVRLPVPRGIEVGEVAEQEAVRVPDAAVGIGQPIQDLPDSRMSWV